MSYASFSVALKSTIDYHAKILADSKGLPFIDLASAEFDTAVIESDQPAICWDLESIDEHPIDPLYAASFSIGAMAMLDPSQYISLDLVGLVSSAFKIGSDYDIYNYSGDTVGTMEGKFRVIACGLAPVQQDQSTNVRFISVSIRAVRYEEDV
jgi:hypothetical protein